MMPENQPVTAHQVPESKRLEFISALFGSNFPSQIEPAVYRFAEFLSADYNGGYWDFFSLSNGGFFMAPKTERSFNVAAENGFSGEMSAQTFGLVCCLYAFSNLSFDHPRAYANQCAACYHRAREFALDHPEAADIFAAID